jgi:phosphoenolpyruvate carboxykinase (ATP)
VRPSVLEPRTSWKDPQRYDREASALARRFADNFEKYTSGVSKAVLGAAPRSR